MKQDFRKTCFADLKESKSSTRWLHRCLLCETVIYEDEPYYDLESKIYCCDCIKDGKRYA